MRTRKLGRWIGRLAAVAAFGLGAVLGTAFAASAESVESYVDADLADAAPTDEVSIDSTSWE